MDFEAQMRERLKAAREIAAKAEGEKRSLSDDERAKITEHVEAAKSLREQKQRSDEDAALKARLDELDAAGAGEGGDLDPEAADALNQRALDGARVGAGGTNGKSLGQMFVESDNWRRFKQQYPQGVPESAHGIAVPPVPLKGGLRAWGRKALVTGASPTSGGAFVWPDIKPAVGPWYPPLTMRDLVTVGATTSDLVEYAQVDAITNAAAPVAEATSVTTGLKPESAMTFKKVSAPVRTVAHWIPITKRSLSDAAQIRTYIDEFLGEGLAQAYEQQMIQGDGTGENFSGILSTTGVQAQAWDTDIPTTIRKAIAKVTKVGASVTAVLVDPDQDADFDLLKDSIGRYYGNGPFGTGPNVIWGKPRAVSFKMTAGTAILGDFRTCVLWDREQSSIQLADQHADFFVRNIVALLAESRAAFGILRPNWLCVADLTA